MDTVNARPNLLKQANLSMIRRVLIARGTATRSEISSDTKISTTTVRSLLAEMLKNREVESIGCDESSGGRKAERYRFVPDRYFSAALCVSDRQIHVLLIDVYGKITETTTLDLPDGGLEAAVIPYLDELTAKKEIKSIGIGVPGVVDGGSFLKKRLGEDDLYREKIGEVLKERYHIPVILENDLNATAIGFGRCYESEFPDENPENTNMAYLQFNGGCVGAGIIAGGRIIRGYRNFAGELGLIPIEGNKLLDECMSESMEDRKFTGYLLNVIGWICGILNPQYIALGGTDLKKECIPPIVDGLSALLPEHMQAEILYSPDVQHDYFSGMAYLTAGKMFDEIQFVKE